MIESLHRKYVEQAIKAHHLPEHYPELRTFLAIDNAPEIGEEEAIRTGDVFAMVLIIKEDLRKSLAERFDRVPQFEELRKFFLQKYVEYVERGWISENHTSGQGVRFVFQQNEQQE